MVGVEGFEPPTSCSQSRRATRLRYTPKYIFIIRKKRITLLNIYPLIIMIFRLMNGILIKKNVLTRIFTHKSMKKFIKSSILILIFITNFGASAEMATNTIINIKTNLGDIKIELLQDKSPITSENFLEYVKSNYFSGTIFHRVIKDFMIQGGGFDTNMNQKETNTPIKNEANNGLSNERGTIAMARTNDPHSASAQFFINLKDNNFLDFTSETIQGWGYCVFGKVIAGMDIVDKIAQSKTSSYGPHQDVPEEQIIISEIIIE